MRFGYWMPIFGGWLRNVPDEGMPVAWPYIRDLAIESEGHGFELSLIAELNLNDIKGHRAPSLDCWTLAPAIAAVTRQLELMLAVRPNYHSPSLTAKALSTLDTIAPGRVSLNVVSSWWKDEAAQYGALFDVHDARYTRTQEWLDVVARLLREDTVTHRGPLYQLDGAILEPKPVQKPRPPLMIAGGGEQMTLRAVARLADSCNVGGDLATVRHKFAVLRQHCDAAGRDYEAIERTHNFSWLIAGDDASVAAKRERYSTSGPLRGFVGTVSQAIDLVGQYRDAGVQLLINSDYRNDRETLEIFVSDIMPLFA